MSAMPADITGADDEFLVIVAKELSICRKYTSLWEAASTSEGGDTLKTLARYIRLRVDMLRQLKLTKVNRKR